MATPDTALLLVAAAEQHVLPLFTIRGGQARLSSSRTTPRMLPSAAGGLERGDDVVAHLLQFYTIRASRRPRGDR